MIEYIKIIILSIFTGALLPLPTSAAAHYSYLNVALNFSEKQEELGFYYSIMTFVFSVIIFIFFRKIYLSSFKSLFNKGKSEKNLVIGTVLSIMMSLILCLPISEDRLLIDYFDLFLKGNGLFLTSFASIISGLFLVIAIWYTKKGDNSKVKLISVKSSLRFSFYQLLSYVIPGLSHVSGGCTNLLISDVEPDRLMAHLYTYLAPQMFFVSFIKIIRAAAGTVAINGAYVIIAVIVSGLASGLFMSLCAKVNMRKLMSFFSVYSILIGIFIVAGSFII